MKILVLIMLSGFILTSCYENTIVHPNYGYKNIQVRVLNKVNEPVSNAKVTFYDKDNQFLFEKISDIKGEVNTQLLEGVYRITSLASFDTTYFYSSNGVQIIGELDRIIELKPFENVGKLNFKVTNRDNIPLPNLYVALLSSNIRNINYIYSEAYRRIYIISKTDSNGIINFKSLPLGFAFYIFIYRNQTQFDANNFNKYYATLPESKDTIQVRFNK